jgi:uncharacterized protein (TIGR02271 family)
MPKTFMDQVHEGMDVYDADDQKLGKVSEQADGYLRVPTGFLGLGTEHHIPLSAIRDVKGQEIYLSVPKDRLGKLTSTSAETDGEYDGTTVEERTTTTTTTMAHDSSMGEAAVQPRGRVDGGEQTLQLREEELSTRKQSVETGQVSVGKQVVSEQRTIDVPVTREEVTIERHAVDRRPSEQAIDERGETISIPVHEEQVAAQKRAVVYEEVEVGKRAVQETQHVSETVRREEAVIDKDGRVEIQGDKTASRDTNSR